MENAKDAVTGTTHTMADGVDVAAGALAAGVAEGIELERYIKLVGDAATGANAPMGEMAQIFNRIQGTGKLTRHELNQRSEEHTSELQSRGHLVCRLLLEKKKK